MVTATDVGRRPAARSQRLVDLRYRRPGRYLISWYALIITVVLALLIEPGTFKPASTDLVTAMAGVLLMASLGQLLIVMLGQIDLSVPAYMTLSAAVNVYFIDSAGPVVTIVLAIVLCAVISAFSGALVTLLRLNSLIVTLAMNTLLTGALIEWLGQTYSQSGASPAWLQKVGHADVLNVNAIFLIAVAFALVVGFLLYRTRVGRQVSAVGDNGRAAQLLGIRVHAVCIGTFAIAGALYGIAGALAAGFLRTPDSTLGTPYQLSTLTAVAIAGAAFSGGPASVSSLVGACFLLQLLDQALTLHAFDAGVRVLVQGALLVLAVASGSIGRFSRMGMQRLRAGRGPSTAAAP